MRELAKRRHASEDPARLKEITSQAGRVSWKKLTEEEQQARIAKMIAARRKKADRKSDAGQSGQSPGPSQRHKRKVDKK
jgi:hypothetical protein